MPYSRGCAKVCSKSQQPQPQHVFEILNLETGLTAGDETRADIPSQYNKNAYLRQQWIISGLTVAHVLFRYLAHCDTKARHDHGEACVTQMRLKGHERVLVVRCGMVTALLPLFHHHLLLLLFPSVQRS